MEVSAKLLDYVRNKNVIFFRWIKDLFRKGYGKDLEVEDLYNTLPNDRSELLGDELQK
jgi:hypothetical protein